MHGVTIRPVAPDECAVAGELVVEAYRTLGDVGDEFYESDLRDVSSRMQTGEVLAAETDGRVVGCVTLSIGPCSARSMILRRRRSECSACQPALAGEVSARRSFVAASRRPASAAANACDSTRERRCRAHSDSMKGWASAALPTRTGRLPRAFRYSLTSSTSSRASGGSRGSPSAVPTSSRPNGSKRRLPQPAEATVRRRTFGAAAS